MFWTPAFAGVTIQGIFYEIINLVSLKFSGITLSHNDGIVEFFRIRANFRILNPLAL